MRSNVVLILVTALALAPSAARGAAALAPPAPPKPCSSACKEALGYTGSMLPSAGKRKTCPPKTGYETTGLVESPQATSLLASHNPCVSPKDFCADQDSKAAVSNDTYVLGKLTVAEGGEKIPADQMVAARKELDARLRANEERVKRIFEEEKSKLAEMVMGPVLAGIEKSCGEFGAVKFLREHDPVSATAYCECRKQKAKTKLQQRLADLSMNLVTPSAAAGSDRCRNAAANAEAKPELNRLIVCPALVLSAFDQNGNPVKPGMGKMLFAMAHEIGHSMDPENTDHLDEKTDRELPDHSIVAGAKPVDAAECKAQLTGKFVDKALAEKTKEKGNPLEGLPDEVSLGAQLKSAYGGSGYKGCVDKFFKELKGAPAANDEQAKKSMKGLGQEVAADAYAARILLELDPGRILPGPTFASSEKADWDAKRDLLLGAAKLWCTDAPDDSDGHPAAIRRLYALLKAAGKQVCRNFEGEGTDLVPPGEGEMPAQCPLPPGVQEP